MLQKLFFMLLAASVLTGCKTRNDHPDHRRYRGETPGNDQKVTVSMDITEAVPTPRRDSRGSDSRRAVKPVRRDPAAGTPAARRAHPGQPQENRRQSSPQDLPVQGIDRELNSVEQHHLREVRMRNRQQQRDNERRVFGGFSDGLFKKK